MRTWTLARKSGIAASAVVLCAALSPVASGYYHYVHYLSRSSPYQRIVEKFDINALDNKAVPFLVQQSGPALFAANDSFSAVVSQIRLAATVWAGVRTSELDLKFAGLFTPGVQHSSPVIEVVFDELPPGVLGLTAQTVDRSAIANGPGGQFVPFLKSTVTMNRDLSQMPSWSESFFLTLTHEMGHAIGLQHSLTSGVMSTNVTRATTKSKPLSSDDVVGVSLLYPSALNPLPGGTIQGKVTMSGAATNLASVVAISLDGTAISAMTNPDGTYRIDGVPSGSCYVYVHALPPAIQNEQFNAGIAPPVDVDGQVVAAGAPFDTMFYPGTKEPSKAMAIFVSSGGTVDVSFNVSTRRALNVFGVQTYSFPGQVAVKPAHLAEEGGRSFILAAGYGLTQAASISVMGGSAIIPNGGVKPYTYDPRYLQMDFQLNIASGEGARHLTFLADGDLYVLPAAFRLTKRLPPQITSVSTTLDSNFQRLVVITGTGLTTETQILFDGQQVVIRNIDEAGGAITVIPPPAAPGQRVSVVALNQDGQSSLFLQANPPVYEYESGDASTFSLNPTQLPAGSETMIEITGTNTNFSPAYAAIALGSSGIQVKRMWVTGPNRILANIAVSAASVPGSMSASVLNGLRLMNQSFGFQILSSNPRVSMFRGAVQDSATGRTEIPAGGSATVRVSGPAADIPINSLQLTVADKPATVVSYANGVLVFRVPDGIAAGPAVVRLIAGPELVLPAVMSIDKDAPVIQTVSVSGTRIDATRPVRPGEFTSVVVSGLADSGVDVQAGRVTIAVGGVVHIAALVTAVSGTHRVEFVLGAAVANGNQNLSVAVDGRPSAPVSIPVYRPN